MTAAKGRDLSNYIPPLRDLDIPNLIGTSQRGLGIQFAKGQFVKTGGGNETISLVDDLGLVNMEDTNYAALMLDQAGAIAVQIGITLTATGFDTGANFAGGETVDVIVIGRIADFPEAS